MRLLIAALVIFSASPAKAEPKIDCKAFDQKVDNICNQMYATLDDRAQVCANTVKFANQLCEDGEVTNACFDQAASGGAANWVACLEYLKDDDTVSQDKKMNACNKAGQVFAIGMAKTYCRPVQPQAQKPKSSNDVSI